MQPEEICAELVPQIVITDETWFFFYGSRKDINWDADHTTDSVTDENGQVRVTYPAAILQKPVRVQTKRFKSGYAEAKCSLFMLFLYDPDEDETREYKQTFTVKARQAAEELVKRFKTFTNHISLVGDETITDIENFTDRKLWGVTLEVPITIKNLDGDCLTNTNNDIVTLLDDNGEVIGTPACRTTFVVHNVGGNVIVMNSDGSYEQIGLSPFVLPDTEYNIFVNGVLDQTFSLPTLKDEVINISP
jgi:hypothetical protein